MTIPFPLPASATLTPVTPEWPVVTTRGREAMPSRDFADALAGHRKPAPTPEKAVRRDVSTDDRRLDPKRDGGPEAEATPAPEPKAGPETTPTPTPDAERDGARAEPATTLAATQQSPTSTAQTDAPSAQILPQPLVETNAAPVQFGGAPSGTTPAAAETAAVRSMPPPSITVGDDVRASTSPTDATPTEALAPRNDANTGATLTPDTPTPAPTGSEDHRPVDPTPTPVVASEVAGATPVRPHRTDTPPSDASKSTARAAERPVDTVADAARRATPDTSAPEIRERQDATSPRPSTAAPRRDTTTTATPRVDDTTPNGSGNVTPTPTPTIEAELPATDAADRHATSAAPAAARATQVQNGVHLENLTGQDGGVDAARLGSTAAAINATPGNPTTLATMLGGLGRQVATDVAGSRVEVEPAPGTSDRIVRSLSAMVNQRGGVMNMRLSPPQLGTLRVQMTIHQGIVTADFTASSPQAQSLLHQNLASLRSALEGHGLQVERLGVHVSTPEGSNLTRHDGGHDTESDRRDGRQDAAGRESRGRQEEQPRDGERTSRPAASFADDLAPFFTKADAEATLDARGQAA